MPWRLLALILFVHVNPALAYQQREIQRLGIAQGVSSNYVVSASQDRRGFIWFATESGLNRFDGYRFNSYKKNLSGAGISGNELNKVFADREEDAVWIATQRMGLNRFDCRTETFTHYLHDESAPDGIITNDITDICQAIDGNLWLSTYHRGVEHFDKKTEKFTHYNSATVPGMASNAVWSVREDQKGLLYIGHVNAGLSILNPSDKTIRNFRHDPADPNSLPGDEVRTVYVDRNDNVWVGTNGGLAVFDRGRSAFVVFRHDPKAANSLSADYVYTINQLNDGKLWIGTENGGINILDIQQYRFQSPQQIAFAHITYRDDDKGLSNATVRTIFQDAFDNVWIGTYGGGVNFIGHRPAFFNNWSYSPLQNKKDVLSNPVAWGLVADNQDRIWVGTDGGGINIFTNGQRTQIIDKFTGSIADDAILSALRDRSGNLWFGTFRGGVSVFDENRRPVNRFHVDESRQADVRTLYEDRDGDLWLGSSKGLYRYHPGTQSGQLFTMGNSALPSDLVRAVVEAEDGSLWIGFFDDGLCVADKELNVKKTFNTFSGFPSNLINHLFRDSKGTVWAATGEGLVRFGDNGTFKTFNEHNGLSISHIRAITEDARGDIWVSTIGGISRYVKDQDKFYHYDHLHGLPLGDFMSGSVTQDGNGNIYFGSLNGVCFFNPRAIPTHIDLPAAIITGVKVFLHDSKLADNELSIPVEPEIRLAHRQNTFNVSFGILDHSLSQLTEYSYMLKGLENAWYPVQGENSVTFRNIPHGTYELLIRSRIKNQDWNDASTSLAITVLPPFWLTWWAKTLYLLATAVASWYVLRFYKRKLDLENSLKLEQLNHRHEQELHDERIRFFTNVTHELRTPLTLILGPLEDLKADPGLPAHQGTKLKMIHKSAARLLGLINQLLAFQKTENQRQQLTVARGDIGRLVEDIGLKYQALNTQKKLAFELSNHSKATIYYDSEAVTTILENLLSNAFKNTQKGRIALNVRDVTERDGSFVEIEVSDSGSGIPTDELHKIFDRYYQVGKDRHVSGTGIGLSLAQNLAILHDSKIIVESRLGEGSIFRFRLNAHHTYPDAIHLSQTDPPPSPTQPQPAQSTGNPVVLVVEDDDEIRDYVAKSLAEHYVVVCAVNGKTGIDEAFKHIPDIIISDIMMPGTDGFALSRTLKNDVRTSHIPIILLTAKDTNQDRKEGYSIGVESYITKPFSAELLRTRITNLLTAREKLAAALIDKKSGKDSHQKAAYNDSLNALDKAFIAKIHAIIENNIDAEKVDVVFLADQLHMSHSTLYRKIKAMTGISVNEFIRKVRIQHAEKLLLTGKYTVSEISYMVGINSVTYFRQCFKEEYGIAPSEYTKRLQDEPTGHGDRLR